MRGKILVSMGNADMKLYRDLIFILIPGEIMVQLDFTKYADLNNSFAAFCNNLLPTFLLSKFKISRL